MHFFALITAAFTFICGLSMIVLFASTFPIIFLTLVAANGYLAYRAYKVIYRPAPVRNRLRIGHFS